MALTSSIFDSTSDEQRWIRQISKILEKEVKVDIDVPVSIFRVPTALAAFKPEAYTPQLLALGPYHHFRPELYEMERYKLAAASRLQKQFQGIEFKQLIHSLTEVEHRVRATYHKYLDMDGETLIWLMAIDGLFLLEFLHVYTSYKEEIVSSSARTGHLVDAAGRKLAHEGILSDIMMLENQVPIFLLSKILSIECSLPDVTEKLLPSMLMGFCKAVSPLKLKEDLSLSQVSEHAHLLDLLYHLTVPKLEEPLHSEKIYGVDGYPSYDTGKPCSDSGNSSQVFAKLWSFTTKLKIGYVSRITKPIKMVVGGPWKIVSSLPGVSNLVSKNKEKGDGEALGENTNTPIVEEIMIPSVSHLINAGIEFCPTGGDITTIKFDSMSGKFYLPVVSLNVHSEVVMRNLVAYEASCMSESLVFTRYTELMNGIIDTVKDAKLLREKKIIVNGLKSDDQVAQVFNGMSKSIRLTSVPYIDKTIEDVNRYYYNTRKVRMYKYMKKYVYGSWKILTFMAALLLMLLMVLQSFCSVYNCARVFGLDVLGSNSGE